MRLLARCPRTSGFTLVEILMVLAIVAMLVALLVPVFVAVREKARQTGCLSNLQQLGTAIGLYAQDYDGKYPLGANGSARISAYEIVDTAPPIDPASLQPLQRVLQPYTRNPTLWHCASDAGFQRMLGADGDNQSVALPPCTSAFDSYGTSYIYRTQLGLQQIHYPTSAYTFDKPVQELGPSEVGVLTDLANWHGDAELGVIRSNVLFADGHVKSQNSSQFTRCWSFPPQPPTSDGETVPDA